MWQVSRRGRNYFKCTHWQMPTNMCFFAFTFLTDMWQDWRYQWWIWAWRNYDPSSEQTWRRWKTRKWGIIHIMLNLFLEGCGHQTAFYFVKHVWSDAECVYLFQNSLRLQRVENPVWFASEFHQVFPIQPLNLNENKSRNRKTHVKLYSNPRPEISNASSEEQSAVRRYTCTCSEHKPAAVHVIESRTESRFVWKPSQELQLRSKRFSFYFWGHFHCRIIHWKSEMFKIRRSNCSLGGNIASNQLQLK